jgi:DNA-binding PadR family transcriptional regulator
MGKSETAGQFEQVVMTAILALREDAYGVTIHAKVQELSGPKAVSLGAVYVTLDRLEDKGFIASWLSDPTPERGGRSKRYYRLEALGERALQESAATAKRVWETLADMWGKDWENVRDWAGGGRRRGRRTTFNGLSASEN